MLNGRPELFSLESKPWLEYLILRVNAIELFLRFVSPQMRPGYLPTTLLILRMTIAKLNCWLTNLIARAAKLRV